VCPEDGLIPIPKEFPLEYACLMGCCIPTGWGSVTNTAKVQAGDKVVVYGLGGIGLNILRACVLRHANPVIAVDIEASKESLAKEFGATHFICNASEDPVPKIQEITGGGADVAFEAIGDPGAIIQAYWSTGVAEKSLSPELRHGTRRPICRSRYFRFSKNQFLEIFMVRFRPISIFLF
jgi:S-(hydroxymethyl)glutathione dehydrogenase/alcohol dehydrogenase